MTENFLSEADLIAAAIALGAQAIHGQEQTLARAAAGREVAAPALKALVDAIRSGHDPLGDAFCALRSAERRRGAGEFCGESVLGTRKGDIIVRLWDQRVMPIECKVSNSSTNSVKRLNNDAAVKATSWKTDFGLRQVVPSAVLGGVYKLHNLQDAQDRGLTIFWAHDLKPLTDWIAATKT
jgi:hypothetical protein